MALIQRVFTWLDAPIAPASVPAAPIPDTPAPTPQWHHPQANRQVQLQGASVAYVLHRARRRSIGFTVGAEGLSVRAPTGVTLAAVDAALQQKSAWIVRKLAEAQTRQQCQEQARIVWADGAVLPYLGAQLRVSLGAAPALAPVAAPPEAPQVLHLRLPPHASPAQIRAAAKAWLMHQARAHFTARLDHFAPLLGVQWRSLRLSSAQTRWGSAKSDGAIRLNWRLLHYRPAVIDYVVAHELAHLRVMDHSPRFWQTVATVVPDYAALRRCLREEAAPPWD